MQPEPALTPVIVEPFFAEESKAGTTTAPTTTMTYLSSILSYYHPLETTALSYINNAKEYVEKAWLEVLEAITRWRMITEGGKKE